MHSAYKDSLARPATAEIVSGENECRKQAAKARPDNPSSTATSTAGPSATNPKWHWKAACP